MGSITIAKGETREVTIRSANGTPIVTLIIEATEGGDWAAIDLRGDESLCVSHAVWVSTLFGQFCETKQTTIPIGSSLCINIERKVS